MIDVVFIYSAWISKSVVTLSNCFFCVLVNCLLGRPLLWLYAKNFLLKLTSCTYITILGARKNFYTWKLIKYMATTKRTKDSGTKWYIGILLKALRFFFRAKDIKLVEPPRTQTEFNTFKQFPNFKGPGLQVYYGIINLFIYYPYT